MRGSLVLRTSGVGDSRKSAPEESPLGGVTGRACAGINNALRDSPARLPGGEELVLSVSVGGCRYAGEDDVRELLAKADAAMYEAKREGRAWVLTE